MNAQWQFITIFQRTCQHCKKEFSRKRIFEHEAKCGPTLESSRKKPSRASKETARQVIELHALDAQQEGLANRNLQQRTRIHLNQVDRPQTDCFVGKPQADVNDEDVQDVKDYKTPSIFESENICCHCEARKFPKETDGFCCAEGKAIFDIASIPQWLKDLIENNPDFLKHIRLYNNALCLATVGMEGEKKDTWSTFAFKGRCYHRIGSLKPNEGEPKRFSQSTTRTLTKMKKLKTELTDRLKEPDATWTKIF